ncbi:SLC13 family permease [Geminicoccus harenae]|uniref:SLC13 family permease n=3 Tax=Geminicoccus harenae TaxID=2498453 RepID=UPI001C967D93|nr:SLC13 family permease [Geminicoccus harenae]
MTVDLVIVLALLVAAIAMFVLDRPRMDAVGLIVIVALPLFGVITVPEALAGFSDPNIVLIAALFVIGEGLVRTGVARGVGDWLHRAAGSDETRLLVLLMGSVALLGAVMSSTAVVAIFIPVVLRIAQNTRISPSRLMMRLSFATLISGMLTLVATTPNLVISSELVRQSHAGFGFFSITPIGLPVLVLGVGYMLFARRWLPGGTEAGGARSRGRAHRVEVGRHSPLAGLRLDEAALRQKGINLLAIERRNGMGRNVLRPTGRSEIRAGDVLLVDARIPVEETEALLQRHDLTQVPLRTGAGYLTDGSQELGMVEVIVPAESTLLGQTVLQAQLRREYGLTVIGLRRGREVVRDDFLNEKLGVGDMLLLVGFWTDIKRLQSTSDDLVVLNLPADIDNVLPGGTKAPHVLVILALVVALMVSGVIPNVQAALIGCLLMGLTGCIDFASSYRSIDMKTLILIVDMLPFSIALQRTGGVDLAAYGLTSLVGRASPRLVLAVLFVVTSGLGLFISNTATAVLMAPVAITVTNDLGMSPYPFAMTVAVAASTAFMTPISSPVDTLVVGPGNYGFGDFVRIGVPFSLVVLLVSVLLIPVFLPLH